MSYEPLALASVALVPSSWGSGGSGGSGATPTLAEVLAAGNDADLTDILNTGNVATAGNDLDTEGGSIRTNSGDISSGGGGISSGGGSVASGGGDILSGGGDLNLGAGLVKSDLVLAVGKFLDLTDSSGVNLKQSTATFNNADQEVPAVALVQDVVDALVNLGLITQAP